MIMEEKKLTREDFKTIYTGGIPYLSFKGKNCEICLESGFGCADIAVYNLRQNLLEPKITLNLGTKALEVIEFYRRADEIVNNFYKKWEVKI